MEDSFKDEINRFREWASQYPEEYRTAEWESEYERWGELHNTFGEFLSSNDPSKTTDEVIADLIYAIARDTEMEELILQLADETAWFTLLVPFVIASDERNTKWQFAAALGNPNIISYPETESALLKLIEDQQEYVNRIALQSLGKIHSSHAQSLCERAWQTNHEDQRIMALWVLKEIGSNKLPYYLGLAKQDGRENLLGNVQAINNI